MRNRADKKLQTDRRTDGWTDRQADSYIPPEFWGGVGGGGYNNQQSHEDYVQQESNDCPLSPHLQTRNKICL